MTKSGLDRPVWSWALYDWASSAFATTVMASFFPVFFKTYWSRGADVSVSTLRLCAAVSAASLTVAVLAPAEGGGDRRRFGRFAAVLGPVIMGGVSYATGNPRLSILAIIVLFVAGAALLLRVRPPGQSK